MKTVVLSQNLSPAAGGAAVSEASLCAALQTQCATVVLCPKGKVDREFVRSFGLTGVKEFTSWDVCKAWVDPQHWMRHLLDDADLLHINGHWKWESIAIAQRCQKRHTPYIVHPRGMLWVGHRRKQLKKIFNYLIGNRYIRRAARLIALSEFETKQWAPYSVAKEQIEILPNGISPVKDTPSEPPFTFPYFLYFGRLESRKNLVFLIEAFSRYRRDGGKGHLILMGPIERAYDKVLYRAIRREGLEAIVHLLAPVYGPDKTRYLKHSVAVIYPAVEEPFGRVPFESVAAGTFPLVPVESGSAEYLAPYLSGCLYPIEDKDALVSCMREIEQLSSVQRTKHLAAARSWVEKKLNWETVCAQVLGVYQSVLAESQSVLAQHTNLGRKNENPMPSMP